MVDDTELNRRRTHLHIVHFEFSDYFNRNLTGVTLKISRSVNVAESAVPHLFQQLPSLQTGILRILIPILVLFLDDLGGVSITCSASAPARMRAGDALIGLSMMGSNGIGLCDAVWILDISRLGGIGIGNAVALWISGYVAGFAYVSHGCFLLRFSMLGRIFMFPCRFVVVGHPGLLAYLE